MPNTILTGKGLDVINKATGGVVMTSASASDADVHNAVQSAHAAYQKFRDMPAAERGQLLLKAGEDQISVSTVVFATFNSMKSVQCHNT